MDLHLQLSDLPETDEPTPPTTERETEDTKAAMADVEDEIMSAFLKC
jgi:hypothetical protein